MGPRAGPDAVKKARIDYPCDESNPSLDYSVRSLATISTELSQILH
jgi:hypothetical protein